MMPTRLDHALATITALALVGSGSFFVARNDVKLASDDEIVENGREMAEGIAQFSSPSSRPQDTVSEPPGESVAAK